MPSFEQWDYEDRASRAIEILDRRRLALVGGYPSTYQFVKIGSKPSVVIARCDYDGEPELEIHGVKKFVDEFEMTQLDEIDE